MKYFEWSDKLDVGVKKVNDEHKGLINAMNILFDLNSEKAAKPKIEAAIGTLYKLTVDHFKEEEAFFGSFNFPGAKLHKTIHKNLINDLEKYAGEYKAGSEQVLGAKFFDFLKLWLNGHIQGIDSQYGQYYKQNAA